MERANWQRNANPMSTLESREEMDRGHIKPKKVEK